MKNRNNRMRLIVLLIVMAMLIPSSAFAANPRVDVYPDEVWEHFYYEDGEVATEEAREGREERVLEAQGALDAPPIHLLNAQVAVKEALATWNENTNWGAVGGNLDAIRNSALNAANAASMPHGTRSRWISPPQIELGGVNIFDGPFFNGILELSFLEPPGRRHYAYLRVMFVDDRRIEWNSTYWENRNRFPEDGIARSDMERNIYDLVHRFGTSRAWGAPNITRVADYIEGEFLEMGFPREQVEIIRVDRRNRGQNPDGSNLPALAIPWIGELNFNVPGETNPVFSIYSHYGNIHYAGLTLPGNDVVVGPEDWPFEAITGAPLVDIGTFPILSIPEGTTGDVIVAVRFVEANLNLTTQLAPALQELMVANPEVNILGAVVARTGRVAWQRSVPGITGGPTSPFPVIMSSCMNLTKLIDRGEDLVSFGLVRRTHNYGVVATIPADVGPGEDPDMIIVVSAHMDSQGLNSPGASDNASGTVVAMDLARYFSEQLNEYGVIPGNRIEIHLAPVGAHEGGGGVISVAIANRIVERGLGGIAINMNMDMVMSPSARADGTLMDAVSMDTWMPPAPVGLPALPPGDAGLRFNLPAYLVMGSITGVAGEDRDPVLADGIVNARIFRFAGSEHQRFNESPRFIEAASMIIVEDTTGTNDIGTFYHNAMDNMVYEYCYTRLSMSRDLFLRGISRAMEQEVTKWGQFAIVGEEVILKNAAQLFQTFDRVAGELVVDDTIIPFVINYPDTSFTVASLEEGEEIILRGVMASGYGTADHRNTARLNNHQHLRRFSTGLVVEMVEVVPEPVLGFDIFNNGPGGSPSRPNASFAASGTIRMWTQLDGVNTPVPFANLTVDARLPDGSCAIRFVTLNRPWVDQTTVNFIDVTKNGPWPRIYLTATLGSQSVEVILVNSRFFTLDLFNNGCVELGATPSRPNPGLAAAGTIRIWTQLNRTNAPVPHSGLVVTARRTDGSCAMEFVTINRPWVDQTTVNFIDVNKNGHWDRIYLTATVFGQSVEVVLVNSLYVPVVPIHFTFDIFNNGEGGSPSRPNPGIEALGVVRLWTQIDGRNIPVSYSDLTVTARLPNGECAMNFVRINRPWADQSTVNHIDVNKRGAWERIYLTATLPGATVAEVILVNRLQ